MSRLFDTLAALAIGAGYTYVADPSHGEERRAQLRRAVNQKTGDWMADVTEPFTRQLWSDEMRWAVGSLGAVLFLSGSRRKGSILTQVAGAALVARAATNRPLLSLWEAMANSLASEAALEKPTASVVGESSQAENGQAN